MANVLIGIEIGNFTLKMTVVRDDKIIKTVAEPLPDGVVREGRIVSWETVADEIKAAVKKHRLPGKRAAVTLPEGVTYFRRITMPVMTVDQLKVNLPYEFRDYITEDKDSYFYDYGVLHMEMPGEDNPGSMELLAAAAKKSLIDQYRSMLRRAGLKLVIASPEKMAYENLLLRYRKRKGITGEHDYGMLDLGHGAVRLHLFTHGHYDITRVIEPGCGAITRAIAELYDVDMHIAEVYKQKNHENVLEREECMEVYRQIAIEVMRVLNFYNFSHQDNNLQELYYCGGGTRIAPLLTEIADNMELKLVSIEHLFDTQGGDGIDLVTGPAAIGITME